MKWFDIWRSAVAAGTFKMHEKAVTIAMALMHKLPLLFLDELTTGLVFQWRIIRALIRDLNEDELLFL